MWYCPKCNKMHHCFGKKAAKCWPMSMSDHLIVEILKYLAENPDGKSISQLSEKFGINRLMLSGYLKAYEEIGKLRKLEIGTAVIYKLKGVQQ